MATITTPTTRPPRAELSPRRDRRSWLWLGVGAVLLAVAGFQTVVPIAAWLAPVFLLRFVRTQRARVGLPVIAIVGYFTGLIAIRGVLPPPGIFLYALASLTIVIVYGADRLLARRLGGLAGTLVFPVADTALTFLTSISSGDSGLPTFGASAYTQIDNLPLLQVVSVAGLWGLGFLIAWLGPVVNELWERGFDLRAARPAVAPFALVMVTVLLFGGIRLAFFPPAAPTVRIAALAPDPDLAEAAVTEDLFARTQQAAGGGARIVAWSEVAVQVDKADEAALIDRARAMAAQEEIYLQVGLLSRLPTDDYPQIEIRAVMVDPDGTVVWDYPKASRPLADGNAPGPGIVPTVDTPYGRLATVICFDADFPWLVRQAGRADADILLVPSSDWEEVAVMHSRMAISRAVENGVAMVRPTRRGVSLAVDHQGRLLGYKADDFVGDDHTMIANVPTRGAPTLYRWTGEVVGYLSIVALPVLAVLALRRRRVR